MTGEVRPTTFFLTDTQRLAIYHKYLQACVNGKAPHKAVLLIANEYDVNRTTISRIVRRGNETQGTNDCADVRARLKGRKIPSRYSIQELEQIVKATPLHRRETLRAFAKYTRIPKTTLWRLLKEKHIKRHSKLISLFVGKASISGDTHF